MAVIFAGTSDIRSDQVPQVGLGPLEAQRRGLVADGTTTTERITAICDGVGPGSAGWLGEQVDRSALLRTAACAQAIHDLAAIDALAPGRLISQALAALGVLDDVRHRWTTGTRPPSPPPSARRGPSAGPPPAQIRAARARSTPPAPAPPPSPATSPAAPPARPPARSPA
ncbi:hypothetical protein [Streptomyces sp. Ag109_O5-1]|uniref:hypothetical protein n=1 Tax=Streptomyces sp. Ag109_O5-1 TaxID=1938851 RepID=UPI000F504C4F|nr:hypothetical protein [Streptomyces sp. Ag109_O5-1]